MSERLPADDRLETVLRSLAERVRALRQERDLSVTALSFEAGLSEGRIRGIETGRTTASLATLVALAETFEVGIADLFGDAVAQLRDRDESLALAPSPYVVASPVIWGGELPPAPWLAATAEPAAPDLVAPGRAGPGESPSAPPSVAAAPVPPAVAPSSPAPVVGAPEEKPWGGPLPPAPWMTRAPEITAAAPAVAAPLPPAPAQAPWQGTASRLPVEAPPPRHIAAAAPSNDAVVASAAPRVQHRAAAQGMRESSAYVFVAPGAGSRTVPRTFADLRGGVLAGRTFRSLQEFAVAAVVEGEHSVVDVARVFRLPPWRLEQWVVETGHAPR